MKRSSGVGTNRGACLFALEHMTSFLYAIGSTEGLRLILDFPVPAERR